MFDGRLKLLIGCDVTGSRGAQRAFELLVRIADFLRAIQVNSFCSDFNGVNSRSVIISLITMVES